MNVIKFSLPYYKYIFKDACWPIQDVSGNESKANSNVSIAI